MEAAMERLSPSKPVLFLQTKVVMAKKDDLVQICGKKWTSQRTTKSGRRTHGVPGTHA